MQIKISGHHVSVTKAMEASIYEKLARVERHFDHINSMHVVLSLDNHHTDCTHKGQLNHKAEAIIRVPGAELFAQACADDMYVSIAMLSEKLDRQSSSIKHDYASTNTCGVPSTERLNIVEPFCLTKPYSIHQAALKIAHIPK